MWVERKTQLAPRSYYNDAVEARQADTLPLGHSRKECHGLVCSLISAILSLLIPGHGDMTERSHAAPPTSMLLTLWSSSMNTLLCNSALRVLYSSFQVSSYPNHFPVQMGNGINVSRTDTTGTIG